MNMLKSIGGGGKKEDDASKHEEGGDATADGGADTQPQDSSSGGKDDKKGGEVEKMKRGDYMIHVYVEQAKNLAVDEGDAVDPMIEINILDEKKYTTAKDDISSTGIAVWNEHLFWEPKNVDESRLAKGKIEIKVQDKGFFKDAMIAYYEFDLSYIYLMKDHALMHKWIIMSNPESDDFGKPTANLKLSITICGSGDEQVQITDDPNPDEEDFIQPPELKPEFYQIHLRFFKAEKIVPMDTSAFSKKGNTDAYLKLEWKSQKLKTSVQEIPEGGECYWNEEILLPVQTPIMGGRIVLKVMDEDTICDETVGSIILNAKDIIEDINGKFFWKNIYGAPMGVSGKHATYMNNNPEAASLWKGRILMQVYAEKTEKPVMRKQKIPEEIVEKSLPFQKNNKFQIMCELNYGIALPDANLYEAKLCIAEQEFKTTKPKFDYKTNFNKWVFREEVTFEAPYIDASDIGSAFVYLIGKGKLYGEKPICYARLHITDFMDPNPKVHKWIELKPDLAVGEVKEDHKAGFISVKMSVHEAKTNAIEWKTQKTWAKKLSKRSDILKVRAYVFQCRDLPAADEDGQSDPYIKIWDIQHKQVRTKTIYDNITPLFYQCVELQYEANNQEELPPFLFDIYDEDDGVGSSDDFLGRATIKAEDAAVSIDSSIPDPKWHPVRVSPGAPQCGEVLVSFSIVESDFNFDQHKPELVNLEEKVNLQEFEVCLNILGLRGLESPGILPVTKAFVTFNLKGLVPPSVGTTLDNIRTAPKAPGPNPTLNTHISFKVPLPTDTLYCPRLACSVYDCIYKGFSQPLIGTFTIPICDIMLELREERQTELAAVEQIVVQLKDIVQGTGVPQYSPNQQNSNQDNLNTIEEVPDSTSRSQKGNLSIQEDENFNESVKSTKSIEMKQTLSEEQKKSMPDDDQQPLLKGVDDANEEIRQRDRLAEKEQNALQGKAARPDAQQISARQARLTGKSPAQIMKERNSPSSAKQGGSARAQFAQGNQINKVDPKLKKELMAQDKEDQERAKRDVEDSRLQHEAAFREKQLAAGNKTGLNVIDPKYEYDDLLQVEREIDAPPEQLFIGLGWDEDSKTLRKHYRRFYPDELENAGEKYLNFQLPFKQFDIIRGQTRGNKKPSMFGSLFGGGPKTDASGEVSTIKNMGRFKSMIEVETKSDKEKYLADKADVLNRLEAEISTLYVKHGRKGGFKLDVDQLASVEGQEDLKEEFEPLGINHLKIVRTLAELESENILEKMLMIKNKCIVRAYMIEGYDFASRDIGGFSDPFLKLKLGEKHFSEEENYQLDEPNPVFYKHYDFETVFPGCPPLKIEAWDYDLLFGDELIGTTQVDLEDRYFMTQWCSLANKPVEYRQLYHPSSAVSQGVIKCWFEINLAKVEPGSEAKVYDITPKPPKEFEMRLCIFDSVDLKMMDVEGTSDAYVRAFFDSKKDAQETDTHFRCQNGKASWNWRLLYKVQVPRKDYRMTIQSWDMDFFTPNEIIGDHIIDLRQLFEDVNLTNRPLRLTKDYWEQNLKKNNDENALNKKGLNLTWKDKDTFYIETHTKNEKDGKPEFTGKLRCQIDIVPSETAEKAEVGKGRTEPNHSPFLAPPTGRLSLSLNPFKMFQQLVGPAMRRKIYCYCCLAICLVLCIYMIPTIFGSLISSAISSIFGGS